MLAEVLNSSSVQRLKGILRNRYGKGLKVNFMVDATSIDVTAQSPCILQGDLRIPIVSDGRYLATAIIPDSGNLEKEAVTQMSDLVQMVLTTTMLDWYSKQAERNALSEKKSDYVYPGVELHAPVFLLESKSVQMLSKVAIQIHEISERWAFLRYNDIKSTLKNIKDIRELGAMTILIEDIHSLDISEQAQLAEYLVQADLKNEPMFLIGTAVPLNELLAKGLVITSLGKILQDNRLELERMPQNFNQLKETLELVLDRHALLN